MATPARLVAEAAGDGYLRLLFKQGDEVMVVAEGYDKAYIVLHYPVQGEMMRNRGDATPTEKKARELNELLVKFNAKLAEWCS